MIVLALVVAPIIGSMGSLFGRHWYATFDQALQMLRISDVGGSHTPLVGSWSRWGWAHPGPLQFWLLAPFYRVFGATGVLTGTAVLNLACVVAAVLLGYRRGGFRLAATVGLMVALLARASGALLIDPWNPWAAFFPFVVFLLLVWSVVCDDHVMLPAAVAVGSFSVQAHAGYLPMVGGLLLLAVTWSVVPIVRGRRDSAMRRSPTTKWLVIAAALGAVLWLPPIIDQLTGGNNLRTLVSYSVHPTEPTAGWNAAFGVLGGQVRPVGPWITGRETGLFGLTERTSVWPAMLTIAAVIAASWIAWRRGNGDAARLGVVALVATGLAVVATARVTGLFAPYVMHWWWAVAAIAMTSILWSAASALRSVRTRDAAMVVCLVGLLLNAGAMVRDLPQPLPFERLSQMIATVGPQTASALQRDRRYLVRGVDPATLSAAPHGLYFELERRGFQVFVDHDDLSSLTFGTWREASPATVDAMVMIIDVADLEKGAWTPPAGAELLATFDGYAVYLAPPPPV
ncbi:MAG: hypothetical protein QOI95_2946 [Acidimicrobiaceae bacterium]